MHYVCQCYAGLTNGSQASGMLVKGKVCHPSVCAFKAKATTAHSAQITKTFKCPSLNATHEHGVKGLKPGFLNLCGCALCTEYTMFHVFHRQGNVIEVGINCPFISGKPSAATKAERTHCSQILISPPALLTFPLLWHMSMHTVPL